MKNLQLYKKLYHDCLKIGAGRETALNLTMVKMGIKDATTMGWWPQICSFLKKQGYKYEIVKGYTIKIIHGVTEIVTDAFTPGAPINRRIIVTFRLSRNELHKLSASPNFLQGLYYGFPMCDILYFCDKAVNEKKDHVAIFADWVANIPEKAGCKYLDFRFCGGMAKYIKIDKVIVHIPCRYNCQNSLKLAQQYFNIIKQFDYNYYQKLVEQLNKPILIYGNNWEEAGFVYLDNLCKIEKGLYTGRYLASAHKNIPLNSKLRIKIIPHRKVEIYANKKRIVSCQSKKPVKWSYCFIVPFDSLKSPTPPNII